MLTLALTLYSIIDNKSPLTIFMTTFLVPLFLVSLAQLIGWLPLLFICDFFI